MRRAGQGATRPQAWLPAASRPLTAAPRHLQARL